MPSNITIRALEMAEFQLLGFGQARAGYSVTQLAESMKLTADEWLSLRGLPHLSDADKQELDDYFAMLNQSKLTTEENPEEISCFKGYAEKPVGFGPEAYLSQSP